ncbi:alpha/beta hydrolase [Actimicrobium sp. CCC2.4]|uniref:alpha/beta fold hydrolase n=1 Tax=Actimicrobium sp. CCC2.4 TaxID=3048606 RepID=UPI002AC8DFFF|nr:alpha/beta hydrolase [Actimicrobium sp. CCC2.4]MEB0135616.1 alpha/beta hydrolase [Actimicrobium sp. CCC2.4]WPX33822.1 alpha/beta hydrolase [Actimicrobium sp. CCC2.4]
MQEASIKHVQCLSPTGLHRMAYKEWGDPLNPRVLVCVHGVTRVSDDFDELAAALSDTWRVVCPDIVGRGRSGRLLDARNYQLPQYVADIVTLLARLDAGTVDWFGTSMGGLIGLGLAGLPGNPVHRLILNDIGPTLNPAALARIGDYIGQDMRFATFEEGASYIKSISLSFGPHSDAQWHKLASDVLRQNADGQWVRHYDLALAVPFKNATAESTLQGEALLWHAYDAVRCPTLLVRGAQSDLLTPATAREMTQRGPKARLVELDGIGHAPTFVQSDQIALVREFLLGQPA